MINDEQIREIVAKVILRLAGRLGANGDKGELIVVFSAATVGFPEAIRQVRDLILDGFRIRLAFSPAAEDLISSGVRSQLGGLPNVSGVEPAEWLPALMGARAVVVPLLSVNTLSRLSMLIADNTASNILLHALLMGKPLVAARNGADPGDKGRAELGFHKGNAVLNQAIAHRFRAVEDFGCILTDIRNLGETVKSVLACEGAPVPTFSISGRFVTASDILHAYRMGANLSVESASGMTPQARDLARRYGVVLDGR
jgi:hypothetical protein